jgi:arylsulfatase A-like enzyme
MGFRDRDATLPDETVLLAEVLSEADYQTAAFVDSTPEGYMGALRGFSRGFEIFEHSPHVENAQFEYDMALTTDRALRWVDERKTGNPFFLFLHTKVVHALPSRNPSLDDRCFPYDQPEPYRFRFVSDEESQFAWTAPGMGCGQSYLWNLNQRLLGGETRVEDLSAEQLHSLIGLYDAGIFYADEQIGRLLRGLVERDLMGNTVVVVTSDHGEAFLEHNLLQHQEVYDNLLHVPLVLLLPGHDERMRIEHNVSLEDIVPTVLLHLGLEVPSTVSGVPLPLSMRQARTGRTLFSYYQIPSRFEYRAYALVRDQEKLVYHNFADRNQFVTELYDLRTDPEEQSPTLPYSNEWLETLQSFIKRPAVARGTPLTDYRPEEVQLRTLGYIE